MFLLCALQVERTALTLENGATSPPDLLTEKDLITLMDKHGIGTDATIAQHIKTIQEREYAVKQVRHFVRATVKHDAPKHILWEM